MSAHTTVQIANHLQVSPNQIKEIREWAKVYWVSVQGQRPTFVSKRVVVMKMTREELAEKIASSLDCTAKVWSKGGKVRVYLSHRGKEYGFVSVNADGVEFSLTGYASNAYGSTIRDAATGIVVDEPNEVIPGVRRLTQSEVDAALSAPRRDHEDDTEKALNAMYGRGGWDRWDREDYEG
jgi:hypothetical protein